MLPLSEIETLWNKTLNQYQTLNQSYILSNIYTKDIIAESRSWKINIVFKQQQHESIEDLVVLVPIIKIMDSYPREVNDIHRLPTLVITEFLKIRQQIKLYQEGKGLFPGDEQIQEGKKITKEDKAQNITI